LKSKTLLGVAIPTKKESFSWKNSKTYIYNGFISL